MLRYQHLLTESLKQMTVRELSKAANLPLGSISDHINRPDIVPRYETLRKISNYYNEPICALMCEHTPFTAELITTITKLPINKKKELLEFLRTK